MSKAIMDTLPDIKQDEQELQQINSELSGAWLPVMQDIKDRGEMAENRKKLWPSKLRFPMFLSLRAAIRSMRSHSKEEYSRKNDFRAIQNRRSWLRWSINYHSARRRD